jgi:hypothetical protein
MNDIYQQPHNLFKLELRWLLREGFTEMVKDILKDRRRRPEGGEWEPIKITHSNLAYIPNIKIRHTLSPVFSPGKIQRVLSLGKIGQIGQAKTDQFSVLVKSDW